MLSLSPIKILIIVAVILVVLGPDKLPEVAHQAGTLWKSLREWQQRIEKEVRDVVPDLPSSGDIVRMARSPVNLLNSLADKVTSPVDFNSKDEPEVPDGPTVEYDNTPGVGPPVVEPIRPPVSGYVRRGSVPEPPADPSLN